MQLASDFVDLLKNTVNSNNYDKNINDDEYDSTAMNIKIEDNESLLSN